MPDRSDEILEKISDLHADVAVVKDRSERIQEDVSQLNGHVRENTTDIASLKTAAKGHGEDIREIKTKALGLGLLGGISPWGIWQAIKAALGNS